MTIDELIKILENYEIFVDDDYGGSYKSVIAYAPDKKVSRAHTPIGTLKIIDTFEEIQKENQELKKQLEKKYEKVGTLTRELLYEENAKLINQQKEFIEWLENEIKNSDICDVYVHGMKFNSAEKMIYKDILSKYKEIIGVKDE